MEESSSEKLIFNGINSLTGDYYIEPIPVAEFVRSARVLRKGEMWFGDGHLSDLTYRNESNWSADIQLDADPTRLEEAGWGIVFPADADASLIDSILEALSELVKHRSSQAGERIKIYRGADGARLQENADRFLARHGSQPGRVDPERVPYHLLIVSDPQSIPFSFQYELGVNYSVGRIYFDTLEEFSNYARSVVMCETGCVHLPRLAAFFGPANQDDSLTKSTAQNFLQPLYSEFHDIYQDQGWQTELYAAEDATKENLLRLLGGPATPALLVSACHGLCVPYGLPEQIPFQGSLVCQDWPGPLEWRRSLSREFYLAAEDISSDANLLGTVVFQYASFGSGMPYFDDWLVSKDRTRPVLAHRSMLSSLPRRLLGHPRGGALAVIGQAERAWGYSTVMNGNNRIPTYSQFLEKLLQGLPVQLAMESFSDRYSSAATLLSRELEELRYDRTRDPLHTAWLLTENNDARSFVLLGDPAVSLPVTDPQEDITRPLLEQISIPEQRLPVVLTFDSVEESERRAVEAEIANRPADFESELVEPPDELVSAIAQGECILWTGWNLPATADLPTWAGFVEELEKWMLGHDLLDKNLAASVRQAIFVGDYSSACEGMVSAVRRSDPRAKQLQKFVYERYREPAPLPESRIYQALGKLGFKASVSITYDTLLEQAILDQSNSIQVYTIGDVEAIRPALVERQSFLFKLFGNPANPSTILITSSQLADAVLDSPALESLVQNVFASRTVFFVGTTLSRLQKDLEALRLRTSSRRHYALLEFERAGEEADANALLTRFNLEVIPLKRGNYKEQIEIFLSRLLDRVDLSAQEGGREVVQDETPRLKWLMLENIGPFESIELELDPQFNILLGDNGVGKTSLLKAIALVLTRQEARPYADRLIRFRDRDGKPIEKGRITLRTADDQEHIAELIRQPDNLPDVRITSRWSFETMKWVALGFPPLRHLGQEQLGGPKPIDGLPTFTPADLIPLLRGGLDGRMQELSQWIVNLDYLSVSNPRYAQLKDDFFQALKEITEGVNLGFSRVISEGKNFQIMLNTDDGEVPIDLISQGTQSLLGWIGYLLERLYDVYPDAEFPREKPALVLIDEIDAHMHPLWQQNIYLYLKRLFPQVQFIATTHSPLVVANAEKSQVKIFERDPVSRQVKLRSLDRSPQGMGVAGLLTSGFFGLGSQLDQTAQDKLARKRLLASKELAELTDDDKEELRRLDQEIKAMGLVNEYRDPLYNEFLKAWYEQEQFQPDFEQPILTEEQRKRQAEIVRQLVEKLKADQGKSGPL